MNQSCFICGIKMQPHLRTGDFRIFKCPSCGLGMTDKVVLQHSDYHRDQEYIEEEKLFKNIFARRVKQLGLFSRPGKVLEVGCSTGILLSLLKNKGWDVLGVEPSKRAADRARRRGIEVKVKRFEQLRFDEKFDLVVLNHTLEHLLDPQSAVRKAVAILKPSGMLYLGLPNFDSFGAKLLKTRWPALLPSEHIWHFTQKSLERLLQEFGMEIIYIEKISGIWDAASPIKELWQSGTLLKKRFLTGASLACPTWVLTKLGQGSGLNIIARKK